MMRKVFDWPITVAIAALIGVAPIEIIENTKTQAQTKAQYRNRVQQYRNNPGESNIDRQNSGSGKKVQPLSKGEISSGNESLIQQRSISRPYNYRDGL